MDTTFGEYSDQVIDPTDLGDLQRRQAAIDRHLMAEGAGHIVHDLPVRADGRSIGLASRPWRLDPIPYTISATDFRWLEEAVRRRMQMLEAVLDDVYGERRLVADGIIDPALLWGSDRYRLAAVQATSRRRHGRWLSSYAVDVVRAANGTWYATADHTDAPSGLGYALLDRSVVERTISAPLPARPLDGMLDAVRHAITDVADIDGPRCVVFSGGIDHPAYVEHAYLATQLGFNLVEGADLVVRDRHVWLQTLGGLEPVDVLYRRLGDRHLDPMETNATGSIGVPGILLASDSGNLSMANAHGTGVLEDRSLAPLWDRAGEELVGEAPWLTLAVPDGGGVDHTLGTRAERIDAFLDGVVTQQPLVIRLHAVASADGISVVPGGNGRVLADGDDPIRPTPCLAKDVWVLGAIELSAPPATVVRAAPQVDMITSVPTRAADSLYWMCRAAERAEAVARACRVAASATHLLHRHATVPMHLLAALCGPIPGQPAPAPGAWHDAMVAEAAASLEFHIGSMLAESASVREFLSATTGRVLGEMVASRDRLTGNAFDVDALDGLLMQLSAFAGLWSESVVRGPAWYFGDFARRYERAVIALTGASVAVRCSADPDLDADERRRGLETVLGANDSLVAYRRRHRSDVELDAVLGLLLQDDRNPRSVAASLAGLERNASAIGWRKGVGTIGVIRAELASSSDRRLPTTADLDRMVEALHDAAAELTRTRLVAPPHPMLLRTARVDPGAIA